MELEALADGRGRRRLPDDRGDLGRDRSSSGPPTSIRGVVEDLLARWPAAGSPRASTRRSPTSLTPVCERIRERTGLATVALSGGVFQNTLAPAGGRRPARRARASRSTRHRQVPPNDGGLALGQAAVAARRVAARGERLMCLAIPGKVVEVFEDRGLRDGARRLRRAPSARSASSTCPRPGSGDYVLVHVGFALSVVDAEEAERTYALPRGARSARRARSAGAPAMKYLDEYRDGAWRPRSLARDRRGSTTRPWTLMEVCGGQTHSIVSTASTVCCPPRSSWCTARAARSASRRSR